MFLSDYYGESDGICNPVWVGSSEIKLELVDELWIKHKWEKQN